MSITLTLQIFARLSNSAQQEILRSFCDPDSSFIDSYIFPLRPSYTPTLVNSPFSSASLSFSQPLKLPSSHSLELKKKTVRYAAKTPIAIYSDIYTLINEEEIEEITSDIDLGYFIGPLSWTKGRKHHPENFDVRRVLKILTSYGPQTSYFINQKLMTVCRTRISAILRQLKIQGIIKVQTAV